MANQLMAGGCIFRRAGHGYGAYKMIRYEVCMIYVKMLIFERKVMLPEVT